MIQIHTLPTPLSHELAEIPVEEFRELVAELMIGKKYLRTRESIEEEMQARKGGEKIVTASNEEDPVSFWERER